MLRLPGWHPGEAGRQAMLQAIRDWVHHPALHDLIDHFGGGRLPTALPEALSRLERLSAEVWDFRQGRERHLAERIVFTEQTVDLVRSCAAALGLTGEALPPSPHYDHALVLGGRVRTCVLRARFTARLLADGVRVRAVAGLGSLRPFDEQERAQADQFGLHHAADEFTAMDAALRDALGLHTAARDSSGHTGGLDGPGPDAGSVPAGDTFRRTGWRLRQYPGPVPATVLAAPSSCPQQRRANTADTLHFWAEHAGVRPGQRVLVVTSMLYATFQHCDAVRVLLPYGCAVETAALDSEAVTDPRLRLSVETGTILQEIRSTIRSLRHLHERLAPSGRPVASGLAAPAEAGA